ncbi:hypothetical protein Tco_0272964 [Tanacetum coccineum]
MEPDIENMTLNEYLKYEAEKEIRLRRNVQSKRMSSNKSDEVDIDNMTIAEYESCIAKEDLKKDPPNDHSCSFTSNFCDQSPYTPNPQPDDEELSFEEEYNNWLLTPSVHTLLEPDHMVQPCVPLLPSPNEVKVVRDEEPNNDSIQVPDAMDDVIQPLIPQVIHTTPPDKDYVAPATKSILDELLEEFGDKILNVTVVDKEADCNPTKDIEELEKLLAKDPQSYFTEI